MWLRFLPFTLIIAFLNQHSRAQSCQSVHRIDGKDGISYIGAADILESDSATSKLFGLIFLKSLVGFDTTYSLTVGVNTVDADKKANSIETVLQFEDGSQISKLNQQIEVTPMTAGLSMSLAEIILTLDDVRQLAVKPLVAVVLTSGKTKVNRSVAESAKRVATCLPITW